MTRGPAPRYTDEQIAAALAEHGSYNKAAASLGMAVSAFYKHAKRLGLEGAYRMGKGRAPYVSRAKPHAAALRTAQAALHRAHVLEVVAKHGGNQAAAARELGVSRAAVHEVVKREKGGDS